MSVLENNIKLLKDLYTETEGMSRDEMTSVELYEWMTNKAGLNREATEDEILIGETTHKSIKRNTKLGAGDGNIYEYNYFGKVTEETAGKQGAEEVANFAIESLIKVERQYTEEEAKEMVSDKKRKYYIDSKGNKVMPCSVSKKKKEQDFLANVIAIKVSELEQYVAKVREQISLLEEAYRKNNQREDKKTVIIKSFDKSIKVHFDQGRYRVYINGKMVNSSLN